MLTPLRPDAFAVFYRRHVRALLGYLLSRTRRPELAADLCAETFAVALEQSARYDPERAPARAWLFAIANSRLVDSARRGQVESRARQRLGMPVRALTDLDLERVEELVDAGRGLNAERLVADLPPEQRQAVLARIVDERDYAEIAARLRVSEAVVRQRVSRGLGALRASIGEGKA
ncbi:MAG: polymerase, sigma-24 subunit, subfamily [Conexibacter sp.]|nr:polymerase, sigma-24 subunit, subfamily [Conexibacter sp.]